MSWVFSPHGAVVAVSNGYTLTLWHARNGKMITTLANWRTRRFEALAVSPDGKTLCAAGYYEEWKRGDTVYKRGCQFHFWDIPTLSYLPARTVVPEVQGGVRSLSYSPDGKLLACLMGR